MKSSTSALLTEVGKLLAMFPVSGMSEEMQRLRVAGYVETLATFPPDAVQFVCARVRLGEYDQLNRAFAPTVAELADLVREHSARIAKFGTQPVVRRLAPKSPVVTVMPPPRPLAELRALPAGSIVSYEEAMLLTDGKPPRGRWDDTDGARERAARNAGPARSNDDLKAGIAERMRAAYPPRSDAPGDKRAAS